MFHFILRARFFYLIVLSLIISALWFFPKSSSSKPVFRTAPISRGDIEVSISATGTVEPEEVVDVGAQVAGLIIAFGTDEKGKTVDYGSVVSEGMVLARIDDSLYSADVLEAEAQLKAAQANNLQAETKYSQAERDWQRVSKLGAASAAISQSSHDAYLSAFEAAKAGLVVSQAAIAQAEAAIARVRKKLEYCTIKSPVNGIIIDRRVDIGQTVVASLNAPSLFLIAKDLKRVQVWVAVNEADIGQIFQGQSASFTVDAFPNETFKASVEKIRLNATMTQNVVTYTVELTTENSSGKLLPYLTANVKFEVGKKENVLRVPNAALRWTPKAEQIQKAGTSELANNEAQASPNQAQAYLWSPTKEGLLQPIKAKAEATDGYFTQVEGEEIREGLSVVIGEKSGQDDTTEKTNNPFAPSMRRGH